MIWTLHALLLAAPLGAGEAAPVGGAVGIPTIPGTQAEAFIDREVYLVGKIVRTGKSRTGHNFLNFDDDIRNTLTVFVRSNYVASFPEPPERLYKNKMVKIRGRIYQFEGKPNIALRSPDGIEVLPADTPLPPSVAAAPVLVAVGDAITVATYNVLNLFDDVDDPYRDDDSADVKPRPQLEALAKSIRGLNADLLALEEVENRGYLQMFVDVFLSDMGYNEVVLFEGNDPRGIDVALVSRLPVGTVTSHRHLRFADQAGTRIPYRRDLLQVRVEPADAPPFDVFVVHLKSKEGSDDDAGLDIRLAEAKETRRILDEALAKDPKARFLICGDFNDVIDSEPVKTILGSGETALRAFIDDLPEDGRISYNRPPYRSMIDFIFASPAMAERYEAGSYRIVPGSPDDTGSDHNPVAARFRIRP